MSALHCAASGGGGGERPKRPPRTSAKAKDRLVFHPAGSLLALSCYLYTPLSLRPDSLPLVAVHGISRNAQEHAAAFAPLAERSGRLLVAPLFGEGQCPRYQQVAVDRCRADDALMATLEDVQARSGIATERIDLFGFSGGAQFAHRFAMLHPDRVARLAVASAGWYSLPATDTPYPYGIAEDSETGRQILADLARFLAIPTLVLVGARDLERDASLRKGLRVDSRQGYNRVERAARWSEAIRAAARERGLPARIELKILGGCGHSFTDCVRHAGLAEAVMRWFEQP